MAGVVTGGRGAFIYISDNGSSYTVSHSVPKASAGGFVAGSGISGDIPRTMKMRHVRGVITGSGGPDSAPAVTVLPIASPSNGLFLGTITSFSVTYPWGTVNYLVTGIFGEKRQRLASA